MKGMEDRLNDFVVENPMLIKDQIYNRIKKEILSGSISPGSRLLEGRLAKQINVSRTPVREALHVLEMEGFLESFPRVGYRVRKITWTEAIEINEIRAVLEPLAAKRAIESEDQSYIEDLEEVIKKTEQAARQNQIRSFFLYDTQFDEIILRASGMKTLLDVWATLRHRLKLYKMGAQDSIDTMMRSIRGHWKILECLKEKDKDGVEKAIKEHLEDSKRDIRRITFKMS